MYTNDIIHINVSNYRIIVKRKIFQIYIDFTMFIAYTVYID